MNVRVDQIRRSINVRVERPDIKVNRGNRNIEVNQVGRRAVAGDTGPTG